MDIFNKAQTKKDIPDIRPGDVVRVFLKLAEKTKAGSQRTQIFEGLVIARKHGKGINATFTIRKISLGVGVERIFPIHCPTITKIELVKRSKVRRAKLYYMRERRGKKARMKTKELLETVWEKPKKEKAKEKVEEKKPAASESKQADPPQSESLGEEESK